MGFNEFLSSVFGNKSTRDMKEIKPWVEKIKAAYPEIEKLDNDALRAKTEELKKYIHESATAERAKVEELKASIETLELEDREEVFAQISSTAQVTPETKLPTYMKDCTAKRTLSSPTSYLWTKLTCYSSVPPMATRRSSWRVTTFPRS